jgi:hypothetical protein
VTNTANYLDIICTDKEVVNEKDRLMTIVG